MAIRMTNRQKALGVTEYGYKRGIIDGEFLTSPEAFLAKAATLKKGEYYGINITKKWFGENAGHAKHEEVQPFWRGLTALMPEKFYYSDTHGLDSLWVR